MKEKAFSERVIRRVSWLAITLALGGFVATVGLAAIPKTRGWLQAETVQRSSYQVGTSLGFNSSATLDAPALVVFFRPDCMPSQRSKNELRELIRRMRSLGIDAELVTSSEDGPAVLEFANALGVDPSSVTRRDLSEVPVRVVPTTVVARRDRSVVAVHEGLLGPDEAAKILESAKGLDQRGR